MSQLGPIGIWTFQFEGCSAAKAQETAAELEELGYAAIWFGEAFGREALTHASLLLAATKRIVIATGIANIYGRDPGASINVVPEPANGSKTVSPHRLLLSTALSTNSTGFIVGWSRLATGRGIIQTSPWFRDPHQ